MATGAVTTIGSVRERNRRALTQAIADEGRRQLALTGAAGLSLRSVSRELGLASSAVYRYVASRDELLGLLTVDAYDALGTAVERAVSRARSDGVPGQFRAFATALRRWALAHPHEYALAYGPPVVVHQANEETTRAASRTVAVLAGLLRDAAGSAAAEPEPPPALRPELKRLLSTSAFLDDDGAPADIARPVLVRGLLAWVQLLGLISFELSGQFGTIRRADLLYKHAVNVMISDLF